MINAYLRAGMPEQAIELVEVMINSSSTGSWSSSAKSVPQPAPSTFMAVLAMFFDSGDVEMALQSKRMLMDGAKDSSAPTVTQRVITFAADMKRMQAFAVSSAQQKLNDKMTDDAGECSAIGPGVEIDCRQKIFPPVPHSSPAADAPATSKIFVDIPSPEIDELLNRSRPVKEVTAEAYRMLTDSQFRGWLPTPVAVGRIIQTFERAGESTRFRKSGIAQNALSVGRTYWS
ncbi:hypothetical protein M378DRAFT_25472 [Amanita muscaria Koide BX008]|uniref:Uncharacterized protein n=1 Tax=Amanita muscaria (strain Koide BX008) TaxID=946122 RepID=A0A0C2T7M9_AMAMK|nr:hypothetical protein M378DRAFT_25472 [Amanita muscaria Koide BX008]